MLEFQAEGSLKEVLLEFKRNFLSQVSEDDMQKNICLRIGPPDSEPGTERNEQTLREELISVLEEA